MFSLLFWDRNNGVNKYGYNLYPESPNIRPINSGFLKRWFMVDWLNIRQPSVLPFHLASTSLIISLGSHSTLKYVSKILVYCSVTFRNKNLNNFYQQLPER